jgi:hypothetical protein
LFNCQRNGNQAQSVGKIGCGLQYRQDEADHLVGALKNFLDKLSQDTSRWCPSRRDVHQPMQGELLATLDMRI